MQSIISLVRTFKLYRIFRTHWTRTCAYYKDISALYIVLRTTVVLNLIHTRQIIIIIIVVVPPATIFQLNRILVAKTLQFERL